MLKVDLFIGNPKTSKTGIGKVLNNNILYLKDKAEIKAIYAESLSIKGLKFILRISYLIYLLKKEKRENSIIHIGSQENAHLINFINSKNTVVTCYDIYPYIKNRNSIANKFLWNLRIKGLKRANKIIAISYKTKKDLVQYCKINPNNIDVVYIGIDHNNFKIQKKEKIDKFKNIYKIDKNNKYILYVGSCEKRKNVPYLIESFYKLKKNNKFSKIKLILITNPSQEVKHLINTLQLNSEIIIFSNIEEDVLPFFYNMASVFVFPSLYEGFGLPPLEAMACGCPVITSNIPSITEIIGNSGIFIDPNNKESLFNALQKFFENYKSRIVLRKMGLNQSKKFSWENFANQTFFIYKNINKY
jgi:glycosyltransferase involved in cell wall biosynthesis